MQDEQLQDMSKAAKAVIGQAHAESLSVYGEIRSDFVEVYLAATIVALARGVSTGYARLGLQPQSLPAKPVHKAVSEI
ncbi:hypothetical protein [Algihabitans albus]|uniref:hypothetical protein n=1 Tax=Algihabitans albus TaxID=2164067 RepID=UPI000E5C57BD|nr:hypothetical protein [Algihabitans albus]